MSRPSWLSLRPAGSPEASPSARARLRLPQAPASLGQSAARAALGRQIGLVFDIGAGAADGRAVPLHGPAARRHGQTRPGWPDVASWLRRGRATFGSRRPPSPLTHGGPVGPRAELWAPQCPCNPCEPCKPCKPCKPLQPPGRRPPPQRRFAALGIQAVRGGAARRWARHAVPGHGLRSGPLALPRAARQATPQ